jgi:tryptophan-rich sensory protein
MFIIKKLNLQEQIFTSFTTESFGNSDLNTEVFAKISELTFDYNSLLFVLYIPLLAIPAWIMFLDKKYNLTEHIIAFIYILSQYSITSFLFSIYFVVFNPSQYLKTGFIIILLTVLYSLYCLKRIFNITLSAMLLRALGFFVLVGIGYIALSMSLAILMFASGAINIEDFGPRP